MKSVIKFNPDGMQGLHFFVDGLEFPVAVGTRSDWEEIQVFYLTREIQNGRLHTEDVCLWCINHQIQYQITYPIRKKTVVKNPYKYCRYLRLKRRLGHAMRG